MAPVRRVGVGAQASVRSVRAKKASSLAALCSGDLGEPHSSEDDFAFMDFSSHISHPSSKDEQRHLCLHTHRLHGLSTTAECSVARALGVPELLRIIAEYLLSVPSSRNDRPRLNVLHLALCCRSVSSVALDVLWEVLPDSLPLFKLLPVAVRGPEFSGDSDILTVCRPITNEDWQRWDFYAHRVHVVQSTRKLEMCGSMVAFFLHISPNRTVLPKLRQIDMGTTPTTCLPLVSPNVQQIRLASRDQFETEMVLQLLVQRAPRVVDLGLEGHPLRPNTINALAQLPSLRKVALQDKRATREAFPVSSLRVLSTLSHLTHLEIRLPYRRLESSKGSSGVKGFAHLQELVVSCSPTEVRALIGMVSSAALHTVHVLCDGGMDAENVVPYSVSLADFIGPLYRGSKITEFRLTYRGRQLRVDDREIETLSKAWPQLRNLHIAMQHSASPYGPGVRSLSYLARHNADLRSIFLSIGDRALLPSIEDVPFTSHRLEKLVLAANGFSDEHRLVRLLDIIIPHLAEVRVFSGALGDVDLLPENKSVPKLFRLIQDSRDDQERRQKSQSRKKKTSV